jgi:hypothetical protein
LRRVAPQFSSWVLCTNTLGDSYRSQLEYLFHFRRYDIEIALKIYL